VRSAALLCLVVLAACPQSNEADRSGEIPGDAGGFGTGGNGKSACKVSADCVPAAATCCDCPAFAINVDDPAHRACTGVTCPGNRTCPDNVTAACEQGFCVLACVEMACSETCAAGYTIDPTGCLSCACAVPEPYGCMVDGDCVETRADCCGCQRGGMDTAVLASEQASFDAALHCSGTTTCPQVPACEPDVSPHCIQGRCELTSSSGLPPGACGRADLPACPASSVCTVNTSDQVNMQGVGVCVAQ
jgi:hypothetical protein